MEPSNDASTVPAAEAGSVGTTVTEAAPTAATGEVTTEATGAATATGADTSGAVPNTPNATDASSAAALEPGSMTDASPVEDFFVAGGAASAAADVAACPSATKASAADVNATQEQPGMQNFMQGAFPMDKMQNGLGAAKGWAAWGLGKVVEGASKVGDKVAEVDWAHEGTKLAQKTDQAVQKVTETATSKARTIGQDLQPGLEKTAAALQPGIEKTAQKAGELAEHMKPKLAEAGENAKKGLFAAASHAAATAIWFQSLGSAGVESDGEGGEGDAAEGAGTAAPPRPEQMPSSEQRKAEATGVAEGSSGFQFQPEPRETAAPAASVAAASVPEAATANEKTASTASPTATVSEVASDSAANSAANPNDDKLFDELGQQTDAKPSSEVPKDSDATLIL